MLQPYARSPFSRFSKWTAHATGHPVAFMIAVSVIAIWALTGPIFGFSDTWQLVINTGTTIVTFLMVFLIQNTQNRDSAAMQLKLDELTSNWPARRAKRYARALPTLARLTYQAASLPLMVVR